MTHLDVQWLANVADEIGWGSLFREMLYTMGPSPSLTDEEQCLQSLRRVLSVPRICPSAAHFGLNALLADALAIQNWFTYRFPMQELFGVILDCCDCKQDACWGWPSPAAKETETYRHSRRDRSHDRDQRNSELEGHLIVSELFG